MNALNYTVAFEIENFRSSFRTVGGSDNQLGFFSGINLRFAGFINIAVCMSCNCNRLFPRRYERGNSFYDNRRPENRSVQNCSQRSVGALPHLGEIIFFNSLRIRRYCGAFYPYAVFFYGFARFYGYLIRGLFPFRQTQIVIFGFQIHIRNYQQVFNPLP